MKSSALFVYPPLVTIIIDSCQAMLIPSTLNKCQPATITPPPRYKAPKRHFLPSPPSRTPPRSLTPQSSQGRAARVPSRLETEPLVSLLFPSEERSSMPTPSPHFRANQRPTSPLSRTERIMLHRPSPSPRFPHAQRRARHPYQFLFPRDLKIITALGLVALTIVYSLALIQIGIATAAKPCSHSGSRSKLLGGTTQHTVDVTPEGSVSQVFQRQQQ